jgi:hypothetical protein
MRVFAILASSNLSDINIIGNKMIWELQGLGLFAFQFCNRCPISTWGYHRNLVHCHSSLITSWLVQCMRKGRIKLCNTCIWSIKSWLIFLCFKHYPNVEHKISFVNDLRKSMMIALNFVISRRKIKKLNSWFICITRKRQWNCRRRNKFSQKI